jgi:hypothetical protein
MPIRNSAGMMKVSMSFVPRPTTKTLYDFERWYAMKTQIPYDGSILRSGRRLAYKVAIGELPSLAAMEIRTYAENEYSKDIAFSEKEAK